MIDTLIKNRIQQLPANTRYAIEHFDWVGAVRRIAQKYHLQLDDTAFLHREVMLSILELITPEEFMKSLHKLPIPEEEIPSLLNDIQQEIAIPLQRIEFSEETLRRVREERMKREREERVSHKEVKDSLRNEGIVLVDDGEDISLNLNERNYSQRDLEEDDFINQFSQAKEEKVQRKGELLEGEQNHRNTLLREIPKDDDYLGVDIHRVPGASEGRKKTISLEKHTVLSPKKTRFVLNKKDTDFLKHIGAV